MFEISYSSLSTFRNCKKKYQFKSRLKLEPKQEGPATSVGKIVHEAWELYFKGTPHLECLQFISKQFDEAISAATEWEVEGLTIGKYTALGMWHYYPFHNVNFDKFYPEQKFRILVPGFSDVFFVGYLDGLIQDQGKYWIREVKTTGLGMTEFKKRADVSYQAAGYIWAMQSILRERVHGIYFDIIRKPLLRKGDREDCQGFAERNYKYYQDSTNHKKLYERHYSYRSELQLQLFEDDLKQDVEDLMLAIDKEKFGRNPDNCFMFGRECPYKRICFQRELPEQDLLDALYKKREYREDTGKCLTVEDSELF